MHVLWTFLLVVLARVNGSSRGKGRSMIAEVTRHRHSGSGGERASHRSHFKSKKKKKYDAPAEKLWSKTNSEDESQILTTVGDHASVSLQNQSKTSRTSHGKGSSQKGWPRNTISKIATSLSYRSRSDETKSYHSSQSKVMKKQGPNENLSSEEVSPFSLSVHSKGKRSSSFQDHSPPLKPRKKSEENEPSTSIPCSTQPSYFPSLVPTTVVHSPRNSQTLLPSRFPHFGPLKSANAPFDEQEFLPGSGKYSESSPINLPTTNPSHAIYRLPTLDASQLISESHAPSNPPQKEISIEPTQIPSEAVQKNSPISGKYLANTSIFMPTKNPILAIDRFPIDDASQHISESHTSSDPSSQQGSFNEPTQFPNEALQTSLPMSEKYSTNIPIVMSTTKPIRSIDRFPIDDASQYIIVSHAPSDPSSQKGSFVKTTQFPSKEVQTSSPFSEQFSTMIPIIIPTMTPSRAIVRIPSVGTSETAGVSYVPSGLSFQRLVSIEPTLLSSESAFLHPDHGINHETMSLSPSEFPTMAAPFPSKTRVHAKKSKKISCYSVDDVNSLETVLVTFYYAAETVASNIDFIDDIEATLLDAASKELLNCSLIDNQGRFLRRIITGNTAIVGVSSSPRDELLPNEICPLDLDSADYCHIVEAGMSVVKERGSGPNHAEITSSLLSFVKELMSEFGEISKVPSVVRLTFLGDTKPITLKPPFPENVSATDWTEMNNGPSVITRNLFLFVTAFLVTGAMFAAFFGRYRKFGRGRFHEVAIGATESSTTPVDEIEEGISGQADTVSLGQHSIHVARVLTTAELADIAQYDQKAPAQEEETKEEESADEGGISPALATINPILSEDLISVEYHTDALRRYDRRDTDTLPKESVDRYGINPNLATNNSTSSEDLFSVEYHTDASRGDDRMHTNTILVFPNLTRILECSTDDESGSETHQCKSNPCHICMEAKRDLILFRVYSDEASV